ncbi:MULTISPECIES: hypothetical protein [unclassified Methanoculleus]|jgi:hypothetical protein|uniref:hypothetical protein n=1 Tax=unclassified Methanoculleus TaxID=2619537 RepID=UPI00319D8F53
MSNGIKVLFGAVLGLLYVVFGLLQFVQAVFEAVSGVPMAGLAALLVPGNVFSEFVLIVVGAVLLTGAKKLSGGAEEGMPFIYVGILLSVGFGLVALCSMGAGALEAAAFPEEGAEPWSVVDTITPILYLAVIGVLGFLAWGKELFRGIRAA